MNWRAKLRLSCVSYAGNKAYIERVFFYMTGKASWNDIREMICLIMNFTRYRNQNWLNTEVSR